MGLTRVSCVSGVKSSMITCRSPGKRLWQSFALPFTTSSRAAASSAAGGNPAPARPPKQLSGFESATAPPDTEPSPGVDRPPGGPDAGLPGQQPSPAPPGREFVPPPPDAPAPESPSDPTPPEMPPPLWPPEDTPPGFMFF